MARHRAKQVQTALPIPDHEGVSRCPASEEVGPGASKVVAGGGSECLAGAKPHQRVGREPFAQSAECRMVMSCRERAAIERFFGDEDAAPLAVTPELQLRDALARRNEEAQASPSAKLRAPYAPSLRRKSEYKREPLLHARLRPSPAPFTHVRSNRMRRSPADTSLR